MKRILRSALVIARRDFVATVWSRAFLLFLLGPLIMVGFGGVFGVVGGRSDGAAMHPVVGVIGTPADLAPLRKAYERIEARVGGLPELRFEAPRGALTAQTHELLTARDHTASIVLTGWPSEPRVTGPARQIDALDSDVRIVLDEAATAAQLAMAGVTRPEIRLARTVVDPAGGGTSAARHIVARGAQTLLFMLTILLAGMLLSNLVEEKSNKVIEVLAAAVPVDSIFLGKLIAMLGVSVTGIAVWGSIVAIGIFSVLPSGTPMPVPAIGWPVFIALAAAYYVMNYMLLGGAFLGIGAQANTVREVQTLSMPITMAQLAVFALASATVNDFSAPLGRFAAIFPLSSPLTMIAHAAQDAEIWPHLLALVWQALWVAIIIRFAARQFRKSVLKSGPSGRGLFRRRGQNDGN